MENLLFLGVPILKHIRVYEQVISIGQYFRNPEIAADGIIKGTNSYQTAHVGVVSLDLGFG